MTSESLATTPAPRAQAAVTTVTPAVALMGWLAASAALVVGAAVLVAGWRLWPVLVALGSFAVAGVATVWLVRRHHPHPRLGTANVITVVRMALAASLIAAVVAPVQVWAVLVVSIVALVLDGFDGWFARKENLASRFGARLDVEVDSALTVVLALAAVNAQTAGLLVLALCLPRYFFVAASWFAPWLTRSLPERLDRKVICVVQVGTLIGLQLPPLAALFGVALTVVVSAALLWSFGRDVYWLWQTR